MYLKSVIQMGEILLQFLKTRMHSIQLVTSNNSSHVIHSKEKHIFFMHNFSGTLDIDIQTEDAEVFIFGLYIGRGTDTFTIKTIQRHSRGKSTSNLFIKGVFFDEAKFAYEGLIRIEPQAQQSNAYQKNQNLIMSDKAYVDSRPYLEIQANDVRCTHGSTTGKLSEDQLLYLADRGLSQEQASALLVEGFIADLFEAMEVHLPSAEIETLQKTCLESLS